MFYYNDLAFPIVELVNTDPHSFIGQWDNVRTLVNAMSMIDVRQIKPFTNEALSQCLISPPVLK